MTLPAASTLTYSAATLLVAGVFAPPALAQSPAQKAAAIVEPAVVQILTQTGAGSGVILDAAGLVATNYHVVYRERAAKVKLADGRVYGVQGVVAYDAARDYAILKIKGDRLPVAAMGDPRRLRQLDDLVALGHPLGQPTIAHSAGVFQGIVNIDRSRGLDFCTAGRTCFEWIRHQVSVSPGNSGGPLVNMRGEVIGLIAFVWHGGEPGRHDFFAVPAHVFVSKLKLGTKVTTLAALAAYEQARAKREFERSMPVYRAPSGRFAVRRPRMWRAEVAVDTLADGVVRESTMFAPRDCSPCSLGGYLSNGVRITLYAPPSGKVFSERNVDEWARKYISDHLAANPGFAESKRERISIGGRAAISSLQVGLNDNITEIERTYLILMAEPEFTLTLELTSPDRLWQSFRDYAQLVLETLTVKPNSMLVRTPRTSPRVREPSATLSLTRFGHLYWASLTNVRNIPRGKALCIRGPGLPPGNGNGYSYGFYEWRSGTKRFVARWAPARDGIAPGPLRLRFVTLYLVDRGRCDAAGVKGAPTLDRQALLARATKTGR